MTVVISHGSSWEFSCHRQGLLTGDSSHSTTAMYVYLYIQKAQPSCSYPIRITNSLWWIFYEIPYNLDISYPPRVQERLSNRWESMHNIVFDLASLILDLIIPMHEMWNIQFNWMLDSRQRAWWFSTIIYHWHHCCNQVPLWIANKVQRQW